jgi:hypothetical protein
MTDSMKNVYLILSFFVAINQINSQNQYTPVAMEGKSWFYNVYDSIDGQFLSVKSIFIQGDTIVGAKEYYKLFTIDEFVLNPGGKVIALIRDDTLEKKTYLLPIDTSYKFCINEEHVLFDFNLEEGEFVDSCLIGKTTQNQTIENFEYGLIVSKEEYDVPIGTINNNVILTDREIWQFQSTNLFELLTADLEFLLEGVGLCGIHNGFYFDKYSRFTRYCEGTLEECGVIVSTSGIYEPDRRVRISPNPGSDIIRLITPMDIIKFEIMDQGGQVISVNQTNEADVSYLKPGIYFVRITGKDHSIYHGKFVKI